MILSAGSGRRAAPAPPAPGCRSPTPGRRAADRRRAARRPPVRPGAAVVSTVSTPPSSARCSSASAASMSWPWRLASRSAAVSPPTPAAQHGGQRDRPRSASRLRRGRRLTVRPGPRSHPVEVASCGRDDRVGGAASRCRRSRHAPGSFVCADMPGGRLCRVRSARFRWFRRFFAGTALATSGMKTAIHSLRPCYRRGPP